MPIPCRTRPFLPALAFAECYATPASRIIPPPFGGRTRQARYDGRHVEAIEAHLALRHNSVSTAAAVAFCHDAGITLAQFVRDREEHVRAFGLAAPSGNDSAG